MSKATIEKHWKLWERMKFRAWWHDDDGPGTMYEVWDIDFKTSHIDVSEKGSLRPHFSDVAIMQYTGMKDKNGKEIYDGDIIKTPPPWKEVKPVFCEIVWGGSSRNLGWKERIIGISDTYDRDADGEYYAREGEVVGNIYENPELLKEDAKS